MRIFAIIAATMMLMGCSDNGTKPPAQMPSDKMDGLEEARNPSAQILCDQIVECVDVLVTASATDSDVLKRLKGKSEALDKTLFELSESDRVEGFKRAIIRIKEKNQFQAYMKRFKFVTNEAALEAHTMVRDVIEANSANLDAKAFALATAMVRSILKVLELRNISV
jgi:hypothetical protein